MLQMTRLIELYALATVLPSKADTNAALDYISAAVVAYDKVRACQGLLSCQLFGLLQGDDLIVRKAAAQHVLERRGGNRDEERERR